MRYLIFNITVLSALGYLFMASPEQSFTSWIGKAPLMYDAAKTAGRDGAARIDSSETAGTALLEAMEPVVEEVLSSSKAPTPELMPAGSRADAPAVEASNMQTAEAAKLDVDAGPDVEPVTIQDIETIIRNLLETRVAGAGDQDDGVAPTTETNKVVPTATSPGISPAAPMAATLRQGAAPATASDRQAAVPSSQGLGTLAKTPSTPSQTSPEAGPRIGTVPSKTQLASNAMALSQAASSEMSDADIAAAFAELQQSAGEQPSQTDPLPSTDMAAVTEAVANGVSAGNLASLPAAQTAPVFMSPRQRADSLDLMVEELQLMYLERTGG
ncbi:MAG: hypothetical protein ACPH89_07070 [Candidatus Puniceispirillaceae bacterium]